MRARTSDPPRLSGDTMSRMKLGLFGAARPTDGRTIATDVNAMDAAVRDRLAGLTPIELAAVDAMAQANSPVLATR